MTYEEAVEFLKTPIYNITRPGLSSVTELLRLLGDPQKNLKFIHVAGTNGKGSVSSMIESVMRSSGYRTGLYTSPFIERFTERIRIGEDEISREELARLTEEVRIAVEKMVSEHHAAPTIFEMVTAVAFMYFFEKKCDIVVLEVGMGGKLDATNVIEDSEISVITSIGMDHTDLLGNTLEEIAFEKAGIIKKDGTVISSAQKSEAERVLRRVCSERRANIKITDPDEAAVKYFNVRGQKFSLNDGEDYEITLLGRHQRENATVAIYALKALMEKGWEISDEALKKGLFTARWNGRLELVCDKPIVIIDGAHNPDGAESLAESLMELFPDKRFTFVIGLLADKDRESMLRPLIPSANRFLTVTPMNERALDADVLAEELRAGGCEAEAYKRVSRAMEVCIKKYSDEIICAFGSLYYIGEVRKFFGKGS